MPHLGETAGAKPQCHFPNARDFSRRKQRRSRDRSVEEFRQAGERGGAALSARAPFAEKLRDFKRVLFRDVLVRAGNNLEQNVVQRRFRGIVRIQARVGEGEKSRSPGMSGSNGWKEDAWKGAGRKEQAPTGFLLKSST